VPVVEIHVPADRGVTLLDPSNKRFGLVDFQWMVDLTVQATTTLGITPQMLPIHLFSYVISEDLAGGPAFGFHYAVNVSSDPAAPVLQTLIQGGYFSSTSLFATEAGSGVQAANTGVLAHEIAEWLNDPSLDNIVPAWQDPTYPTICDNSLMEVGDPLEGISHGFQVASGGRSYSFPDVAFQPWFSRTQNSFSANGWFSFLNNFPTYSAACPVFTSYAYGSFDFIGADSTVLTGINNSKQAVGYLTGGFGLASVLINNFDPIHQTTVSVSLVNVPGSRVTVASKINDAGNIVGGYADSTGAVHGFLFSNGRYTTIDFPGAIVTEALAINNKNNFDIVGDYTDTYGRVHGFLLQDAKFSTIDAPFAVNSAVYAINDKQKIAGVYDNGGTVTGGFGGTLGAVSVLSYPDRPIVGAQAATRLYSLNNADEIVGTEATFFSSSNLTENKGFLEGGGNFQPSSIGVDDAFVTQYLGNNDLGIVVGSFQDLTGNHGLFAVPAPLLSNLPFASMKLALP
jgi:probable HAF family extracellular repeat protein